LLKRPEFEETPESRAKLADLSLEYHARAALRTDARTADVKVAIRADHGKLLLEGITASADERHTIAEVVARVAGVKGVDNKLRVMKDVNLFPSHRA
jgi:osmotically-inducible protein OsmY